MTDVKDLSGDEVCAVCNSAELRAYLAGQHELATLDLHFENPNLAEAREAFNSGIEASLIVMQVCEGSGVREVGRRVLEIAIERGIDLLEGRKRDNEDHDVACCDCGDCDNERRAEASH